MNFQPDPHAVCILLERQRLAQGHAAHPEDSPERQALCRAVEALASSDDPLLLNVASIGRELLATGVAL